MHVKKIITFKYQGQTLTGIQKSEHNGYFQVFIGETEYILTDRQILNSFLEATPVPLELLTQAIRDVFIKNTSSDFPSMVQIGNTLNVDVECIRQTLKENNITWANLIDAEILKIKSQFCNLISVPELVNYMKSSLANYQKGSIPSFEKFTIEQSLSINDLKYSLKTHNLLFEDLIKLAANKQNNTLLKLDFTQNIHTALINLIHKDKKANEFNLAKELSLTTGEFQNKCLELKITLPKVIRKFNNDYQRTILNNTPLLPNQLIWKQRILTISDHAQERLQERFNMSLEDFKALIPKMAEVEKTDTYRKRAIYKHQMKGKYFVHLQSKLSMVVSENLEVVLTVYNFHPSLLKAKSIKSITWSQFK